VEELIREYQVQISKIEKRIRELEQKIGYTRGEERQKMQKRIDTLGECRAGLFYSLKEMTKQKPARF
jgi:hypothetical protein